MIDVRVVLRAWGVATAALLAAWAVVYYAWPLSETLVYLLLWGTCCVVPAALTLRWAREGRRRAGHDGE